LPQTTFVLILTHEPHSVKTKNITVFVVALIETMKNPEKNFKPSPDFYYYTTDVPRGTLLYDKNIYYYGLIRLPALSLFNIFVFCSGVPV
jgi:hypothetical protein